MNLLTITLTPAQLETLTALVRHQRRATSDINLRDELFGIQNALFDGKDSTRNPLIVAGRYGQIAGDQHRTWTIDQMMRAITGPNYDAWVAWQCANGDDDEPFTWSTGKAPEFDTQQPLDYLNELLDQGGEYPDAEGRTCQKFNVNADDLRADYDRQFA